MRKITKIIIFTISISLMFNIKLKADTSCWYYIPNHLGNADNSTDYTPLKVDFKFNNGKAYFYINGQNASYDIAGYNVDKTFKPVSFSYGNFDYIYGDSFNSNEFNGTNCPELYGRQDRIVNTQTDCFAREGGSVGSTGCEGSLTGLVLSTNNKNSDFNLKKCSTGFSDCVVETSNSHVCAYHGYLTDDDLSKNNLTTLYFNYKCDKNNTCNTTIKYDNNYFQFKENGYITTLADKKNNYKIEEGLADRVSGMVKTYATNGNDRCPDLKFATEKNGKTYEFKLSTSTESVNEKSGIFTLNGDDENHISMEDYEAQIKSDLAIGPEISQYKGVCTDYLGSADTEGTIAWRLDELFTIVKIGSIVVLIILSMLDFAKCITSDKEKVMSKVKVFVKRLIILIIILLIPGVIDMIGNMIGIEDILCGIK